MDKNSIKKFAVWAHRALIASVSRRAQCYGIREHHIEEEAAVIDGRPLTECECEMRRSLVRMIQRNGYWQTIENVAYTWFNRFCALRFMEVNGYLPAKVRVFTDENGQFNPQILTEALHLGECFDHLDKHRVYDFIEKGDDQDALYQYLIVTLCHELGYVLPGVFTKNEDYTELLFPANLLDKESVVGHLVSDIPEDYFRVGSDSGQVEIIGWLYQYYFSEKHEAIIDPLHGTVISAEDIPVATQLFTTDWVVRYIVDNSVGQYWIAHHAGSSLASELKYYIQKDDDLECTESVSPQDVTVFDPCVGSGFFLIYAIDVLMKIYRECGYSDSDAIAEIVRQNISGLDIDERAVALAHFTIMMKGCQYDRHFLERGIQPRVDAIIDGRFADDDFIKYLCGSDKALRTSASRLLEAMKDASETGSLIQIPDVDLHVLDSRISELSAQSIVYADQLKLFRRIVNNARVLSEQYAAVITNPPYLNKYDSVLKSFLLKNYKDYSGDLFSVFIYRCMLFCESGGYTGLMTPNVWMFIKSYAKLRQYILSHHSITTLVQMAKGAFFSDATVDVCAFVIQCERPGMRGDYFRLEAFTGNMDYQNQKLCEALADPLCSYRYGVSSSLFESLPGMQIGYWAGEQILSAFQTGHALEKGASPRQGLATTDNNKYLRHWYEVAYDRIGFGLDRRTAVTSDIKWFPYNKGGEFRKWYGNQDYIVDYQNDGESIKRDVLTKYPYLKTPNYVVKNPDTYFRPSLSWSKISSGSVAFRYFPQGFLYDVSGCSIFFKNTSDLYYYAGFLNCIVCAKILEIISPTLNYETGHIAILPMIDSDKYRSRVEQLVAENIRLSEEDWNKFEVSWNYTRCPLCIVSKSEQESGIRIADIFNVWKTESFARFDKLKANEEELNRIFIEIYGLQKDLVPQVDDKDVTVRKADLVRDIKCLISYAVGCMFGRYSLDREGLCYAGGDSGEYFAVVHNAGDIKMDGVKHCCDLKNVAASGYVASHFDVVVDNIIPITDDAYFADDIVNRFVDFLRTAYGTDTLEANLKYVAEALGGKGTARDVIRNYFLNDFYPDHFKMYQKRPIYWLFSSGKKNGFKCLVYMHRYQPDTIGRICTDYVHRLQSRYSAVISKAESRLLETLGDETVMLKKQIKKLKEQSDELKKYEEKLYILSDQMIAIDLDDGVKVNYAKFGDVLYH